MGSLCVFRYLHEFWILLIRFMRYLQEIQSRCISFFSTKNFGRNFYHDRNFYPNVNFGMLKKVKNRSTVNKYVATWSKSWNMCPMSWKTPKNRFTCNSADSDGRNRPIRPIWQNLKISYFSIFWGHFLFILCIVIFAKIRMWRLITMQKMIILHQFHFILPQNLIILHFNSAVKFIT